MVFMTTQTITHDTTIWIDIVHPSIADVDALKARFPFIHPLHLEDLRSMRERPKVDVRDEYLYISMHFPRWDAKAEISRAEEIDFIVGTNFIITVHEGHIKPLGELRDQCLNSPEMCRKLLNRGSNDALYKMVDVLIDYIEPILDKIDDQLEEIEETIFTANTQKTVEKMSIVRRDIIVLRRIIRQQVPVIETLRDLEHPILRDELEEYFGDIADHIYRERDAIDEDVEIIHGLSDTLNVLSSYRVNEIIRTLTVISVVMLPLTFLSSVYGMNINLPLDDHPYGFFIIVAIMLVISFVMVVIFRRRGWV
jgi:magnesium transporter